MYFLFMKESKNEFRALVQPFDAGAEKKDIQTTFLNEAKHAHTLYLCYFGLREPLVQTQVLPYLREIVKDGIRVSLLTFEPDFNDKWTREQIEIQQQALANDKINWYCLPYHKSPSVPATLYDVFAGARFARKMIRENGVNVLHARTHVPAMMAAMVKSLIDNKIKIIFDIRGFVPEEYTDIGHWKKDGWLYKAVKSAERRLLKNSDAFVVLTEKAREILFPESLETGFDRECLPFQVADDLLPIELRQEPLERSDCRRQALRRRHLGSRPRSSPAVMFRSDVTDERSARFPEAVSS